MSDDDTPQEPEVREPASEPDETAEPGESPTAEPEPQPEPPIRAPRTPLADT